MMVEPCDVMNGNCKGDVVSSTELKIPTIVLNYCSSNPEEEEGYSTDLSPLTSSSTNTSIATSCGDNDDDTVKSDNNEVSECDDFMKTHVAHLFDSSVEISTVDKHTFGKLCQISEGRELFAKYVNKQRCHYLQVDETTFYKLAHSFALVLFECSEADDFIPGKTLMNMAFTYYHYPEGTSWQFRTTPGAAIELQSPDMKEYTVDLSGSDGEADDGKSRKSKTKQKNGLGKSKGSLNDQKSNEERKSIWKTANNWLNKEITTYKQFFKEASLAAKQIGKDEKKTVETGDSDGANDVMSHSNSENSDEECRKFSLNASDFKNNEKIYLYQALRHQTIWQSLRFWNAAFFDAVNGERQDQCLKLRWNSLTDEERESANETIRNVTFGQLGTFINNMKHLGLGQETCLQFLRKQSVIGNLNKDLYQMLRSQIDEPLPVDSQ